MLVSFTQGASVCIFFSNKGSVVTFNTSSYSVDKLFAAAVCTCRQSVVLRHIQICCQ